MQAAWTRRTADSGWCLLRLQRFPAEPGLDDAEPLDAYPLLHLGEVGLAWGPVSVSADLSEVGVPPEAFQQVIDVGYLLYLAEHEGS